MADAPRVYGVGFARSVIGNFLRAGRTATYAYNYLKNKYPLQLGKQNFFRNFAELKSTHNFAPLLGRLNPDEPVTRNLVNPISRIFGKRYEYKLLFQVGDPITDSVIPRYVTIHSDTLISLSAALEALREKQAQNPFPTGPTCPPLGDDQTQENILSVAIHSVSQHHPGLR